MSDSLPWARNPEPPDEPCANPTCEVSVYFPDERSFWASVWIPSQGRENPVTARACSMSCLAAVLQDPVYPIVDTRWGQ